MKFKSICVVGVDGTGKSSTIDLIKTLMGEDVICVQYMGARLWETQMAQDYIGASNHPKCSKLKYVFMSTFSHIYEMYYRVYKHRKINKIVLFDRYAYEQALFRRANSKGVYGKVMSFIYSFFLLWLFPKPDLTFYLKCPLDISIKRKTDINSKEEIEGLKRNKRLLDKYYENRKNVYVLDTSKESQQLITRHIVEIVNKTFNI